MTNERNLDGLIDYAQHALGEGYPYEVTEQDLALTLEALKAYRASRVEPSAPIPTWRERCQTHPEHGGIVNSAMIQRRMQEEIDDLRSALNRPAEPT